MPFKPADFARIIGSPLSPIISLPPSNDYHGKLGSSIGSKHGSIPIYIGIGILALGLIGLAILIMQNQDECANHLSKLSQDMKMNAYLLNQIKSTNDDNQKQRSTESKSGTAQSANAKSNDEKVGSSINQSKST